MAPAARAAKLVPNPLPRRAEIRPFESWEEIEAVAEGVGAVGTVRRTFSGGELHEYGKTSRSLRRVPLRQRVLHALEAFPHVWIHRCSYRR